MVGIPIKLKDLLDYFGWKYPYHEHFKVVHNGIDHPWNPNMAPIYISRCTAKECEAPGCPRTDSGFPETED